VMPTSNRYEDRPLVYLAAPYTHPDPVANTHAVIALASELVDEGLVTPLVPHLTLLWHLAAPRPLDFWYAYDVAMLHRCDALFRMEGASSGADREVDFATTHGIPVFTSREELNAWAIEQLASPRP
jgi:nucleoside 2-deoxyribosyltransferase